MGETLYELTFADQKEADAASAKSGGGSGQHEYLKTLGKSPLAVAELGRPRGYDHIHLSQADGTPFVRWMGRGASGYHYQIGRWMKLLQVAEPSP